VSTTTAHFEAIGRVAYEWSRLEFHIQIVIAGMTNQPIEQSLILTNATNMRSWADMVLRLANKIQCEKSVIVKFTALKNNICETLLPARNKVVHGIWSISSKELYGSNINPASTTKASVLTLLKMGKEMKREDQMTAEEVLKIAEQIREALRELIGLASLLIPSLPNKPALA
jgi:hypothetical protein